MTDVLVVDSAFGIQGVGLQIFYGISDCRDGIQVERKAPGWSTSYVNDSFIEMLIVVKLHSFMLLWSESKSPMSTPYLNMSRPFLTGHDSTQNFFFDHGVSSLRAQHEGIHWPYTLRIVCSLGDCRWMRAKRFEIASFFMEILTLSCCAKFLALNIFALQNPSSDVRVHFDSCARSTEMVQDPRLWQ